MAKYGKKASDKVEKAMHEMKRGKLKSGRTGKTVKSKKQAVAIGLSEARREGGKVPKQKTSGGKSTARKKAASRKATGRKTASRKTASRKKTTARKKTTGRKKK